MSAVLECVPRRRHATVPALFIQKGDGYVPASDEILLKHLRNWAAERFRPGAPLLQSSRVIEAFVLSKLAAREREVFALILLDRDRRLIEYIEIAIGGTSSITIHAREIVRAALSHDTASVILAHNHTSGVAQPSEADVAFTRRLRDALAYVDIRVLDHLIVGKTVFSFEDHGLLKF